jgi:cell division septation protein DedD
MTVVATDLERYADPNSFAREVNLPLLGSVAVAPVAPGANLSALLGASSAAGLDPVVEGLAQTRQSLTLRSLLLAGFPHDPECFALGLALGRSWSRRGLKVAVVDLDAWHPTILRAVGEPSEGLIDVLEYGCSFQRVAWELVAGSLWVVGPGSHPVEEGRLADHAEWDRAGRVFSARADVTLYVAPLLHRQGLTGRLSKRMDGVLLTASVDRVSRIELRDAFLELWGSDAPIIGCVGIDANAPPTRPARPSAAAGVSAPPFSAAPPTPARAEEVVVPPASATAPASPAPLAAPLPAPAALADDEGESALAAALDREIRLGAVATRRHRSRRLDWIWKSAAVIVVGMAGAAGWMAYVTPPKPPLAETRPAGEETVLPAPDAPDAPNLANLPLTPPETPVKSGLGSVPGGTAPPAPAAVSPAAVSSPAATPLSTAPPADGKPYRVHVASFRSEEKVAPIVRQLRLKGVDAWFEQASDGSGWYRVFVGRFATEDEARAYASWLLQNRWVDRAHAFPSTSR